MFALIAFYPSLTYNILRSYMQPKKWSWYNRIDEVVLLGALPFQSTGKELRRENVGGVVCCSEDYEIRAAWKAMKPSDWSNNAVEVHHVPMKDFTGTTSCSEIDRAVQFINKIGKTGKSVYVHCKAGRTRSTMIVVCYLMRKKDWMPNIAFDYLKLRRPQVLLRAEQWRSVNDYRRLLDSEAK